ncbi:MAG: SWFGD domain-containing protein [Pseudomonadota bacterium]
MKRKNDRRPWREPGYGAYGSGYGSAGHIDNHVSRGAMEKITDELAAWFGDDQAQQRRKWDHARESAFAEHAERGEGEDD